MLSRWSRRLSFCCRRPRRATLPECAPGKGMRSRTPRCWQKGPPGGRHLATAHGAAVATHLLSNGRYAVMLTAAGSGYSRWRGMAVTRWREDATCDDWGSYVFLRDVRSGDVWSAGFQPSGAEPHSYRVAFNEDRAEITRQDGALTTTLEVLVSAEDDAEVRRISIANAGDRVREIDVTSYSELVLAPQADDVAHPAFLKLFVATDYLPAQGLCWQRDADARRQSRKSGRRTWLSWMATRWGSRRWRPTAPVSSAAATASTGRLRWLMAGPCPTRSARYSIRSSRCATACVSRQAPPYASRSGQWLPKPARRCSTLSTSIATARRSNGQPRWRGPRRRCNSIISVSIRAKRACSSGSPAICCMLDRRCGLRPTPSCAVPAGSRGCGPWAFPATCRSYCCASPTSRISTSPANCCRRTSTGG